MPSCGGWCARACCVRGGAQVREYVAPEGGEVVSAAASEQLKKDVESKKAALEAWCKTAYGEVGSALTNVT